jgi:hypothetical protein
MLMDGENILIYPFIYKKNKSELNLNNEMKLRSIEKEL